MHEKSKVGGQQNIFERMKKHKCNYTRFKASVTHLGLEANPDDWCYQDSASDPPLSSPPLQCSSDLLSLSARHSSSEVVNTASSPGNDGSSVLSGGSGDNLAQSLGGKSGLNVDIGLSGDLLVDVGLSSDLLVHIGHLLGEGHGAGDSGEEDLT